MTMLLRDGEFSPMEVSRMQKLFFALMLIGTSAMAAPISCAHTRSKYQVWVHNDHRTAELSIGGKPTQFGKLVCRAGKRLVCASPHVADAGYQATFTRNPDSRALTVQVDEFWFGGTRPLAALPCVEAQNF
jgi:hypothetical protein